ncbi:conserved hypothetical protein [Leishmania braziliensis MHOM/BR/75/M2904]|uniref:tRNA/rRNA methyltransferase SpoU type domain-containing protein n=2 Tax=Leishmania braziliensis TaxID=5660 RepID=A4H7L7_LEIBR|nr:conserved hypothetical protein [Leishmania braziliensis MHOM/BR/75/M2904]CAJ2469068.1 unnamed protein product [Leishmania braziliensis]CAM37527.1 conserved hypothetical protein [Leishmania braziliensis MHOM/BR/75/M2904]
MTGKKGWGAKTAWSMSFFEMVPWVAEDNVAREGTLTAAAPASSCASPHALPLSACDAASKAVGTSPSSSTPPPHSKPYKERKRQELDLRTRWRCRRCGMVLQPPLDAVTGKPRYGVMMTEHLEGVSSGGTTHLATGVVACTAGTMRYEKASDEEGALSPNQPNKRPRDDLTSGRVTEAESVIAGTGASHRHKEGGDDKAAACEALRRLLHQCQQGARQCDTANSSPLPLLFIVVENPKTPANAGGILRAMRCYGLHGPAAAATRVSVATTVAVSLPVATTQTATEEVTRSYASGGVWARATTPDVVESTEGSVRQRVGSFIFSGTRLQNAMAHSEYAHTLRTDPTHAGRDIPQLRVPTLDVLFDVLRGDYGHRQKEPRLPSPSLVSVVAVELVEGAVPLPFYEHPFGHLTRQETMQRARNGAAPREKDAAFTAAPLPMVFYVFGAEDGTLSAHHLQHDVDDVVFIPTTGSMNLAATVNVLLYDRLAKECRRLHPAVADATAAGMKWKDVFGARNANNRIRWTRSLY